MSPSSCSSAGQVGDVVPIAVRLAVRSSITDPNMDREGIAECTPEVPRRGPFSLASQRKPCKYPKADARTRTGDPFITREVRGRKRWVTASSRGHVSAAKRCYETCRPGPDRKRAWSRFRTLLVPSGGAILAPVLDSIGQCTATSEDDSQAGPRGPVSMQLHSRRSRPWIRSRASAPPLSRLPRVAEIVPPRPARPPRPVPPARGCR
jgi:hypothetical protein